MMWPGPREQWSCAISGDVGPQAALVPCSPSKAQQQPRALRPGGTIGMDDRFEGDPHGVRGRNSHGLVIYKFIETSMTVG